MKKIASIMILILFLTTFGIILPFRETEAVAQSQITRSQAEQRALSMINLTWTYSSSKNSNISPMYASYVSLPSQFNNVTSAQFTGIPYAWGGFDGLDTSSANAPWSNFLEAVNAGAYTGNNNTTSGLGSIPGTAGLDCSGFVQAVFNIHDYKLSTSTLFSNYFTKINMSDIKHMDILNKPGSHVAIFDKWGTLNGLSGAFTYESTSDKYYGGIEGTKHYFLSMNTINNGYIPGRYINIVDDPQAPAPVPTPVTTTTPAPVQVPTPAPVEVPAPTPATQPSQITKGIFAQIANVNTYANIRSGASTSYNIIGTIPKGTIIYLIDYSSGWYQIKYNGQLGWVSGSLITSIPSGKYVTLINAAQLNIRSNPSTTSSILGVLSQNQYAQVIDYSSDGQWYKISINGIQGWSSKYYLSFIY